MRSLMAGMCVFACVLLFSTVSFAGTIDVDLIKKVVEDNEGGLSFAYSHSAFQTRDSGEKPLNVNRTTTFASNPRGIVAKGDEANDTWITDTFCVQRNVSVYGGTGSLNLTPMGEGKYTTKVDELKSTREFSLSLGAALLYQDYLLFKDGFNDKFSEYFQYFSSDNDADPDFQAHGNFYAAIQKAIWHLNGEKYDSFTSEKIYQFPTYQPAGTENVVDFSDYLNDKYADKFFLEDEKVDWTRAYDPLNDDLGKYVVLVVNVSNGTKDQQDLLVAIDAAGRTSHPTPEPATLAVLGLGMLGMIGVRRMRRTS